MAQLNQMLDRTLRADDLETLKRLFSGYLDQFGSTAFRYYLLRESIGALSYEDSLIMDSFPADWAEQYRGESWYEDDSILQRALLEVRPFRWPELQGQSVLSEKQSEILHHLRGFGFPDGLAIPVFGPFATAGCFVIGGDKLYWSDDDVCQIQIVCQQIHSRAIELRSHNPQPFLSEREREVLQWAAQGKSNGVIAEILGVSEHTIDTNMRRIFTKLDVSNRIAAVLKAAGTGIVAI